MGYQHITSENISRLIKDNSWVKLLVEYSVPTGMTLWELYQEKRMRAFFDELDNGQIELDESRIREDDFLHAFYSTLRYALRSKSDEKTRQFAKILKGGITKQIDKNEFEDIIKIFDDLTEREFTILCLKYKLEQSFFTEAKNKKLNPLQTTSLHWKQFIGEIITSLNIEESDIPAIMFRLQRTGCYLIHTGYMDGGGREGQGITTSLFHNIHKVINEIKIE